MAGKLAGRARGLSSLRLGADGAALFVGAAHAMLPVLADWFGSAPTAPGTRITRFGPLAPFLTGKGPIARLAADLIGPHARPVRAVAFEKSPATNWALGWHQDRTINVAGKSKVEGFGPWTVKQGSPHVQPPFSLVEKMITLRIHLDPVTPENGPLEVALGSHKLGYLAEQRVPQVIETSRILACLAEPGDVWGYATPILHASRRSTSAGQRRVLQVDFSAESLPPPSAWALETSGNHKFT